MSDLSRAESYLRRDDKALRLRYSAEGPFILVERKTKRGQIGKVGPEGLTYKPDAGRRWEEGHVPVCQLPREGFDVRKLRDSLQEADTWHKAGWIDEIERRDRVAAAHRKTSRMQDMRYRASQVWDKYAWRSKSRIGMRI